MDFPPKAVSLRASTILYLFIFRCISLTEVVEEHDFMLDLCFTVLNIDKIIRFAGVMDNSGKLMAAKYRNNIQKPLITSTTTINVSSNSFYSGYISLSINKKFESALGELHFQLTEFDKVMLLTIPLISRKDQYLCVSMDSSVNYERVISKILENI